MREKELDNYFYTGSLNLSLFSTIIKILQAINPYYTFEHETPRFFTHTKMSIFRRIQIDQGYLSVLLLDHTF